MAAQPSGSYVAVYHLTGDEPGDRGYGSAVEQADLDAADPAAVAGGGGSLMAGLEAIPVFGTVARKP